MSIAQLFAQRNSMDDRDLVIAKLRSEVDRLKHMRSGTYTFRIEQVRLMATAIEEIERGQTQYGLRMMIEVMDDLRPDWRSL